MRQRQAIQTTLGDLIVAVTDEVGRFTDDTSSKCIVVSLVLQDLFARRRVRLTKRMARRRVG